MLDWIKDNRRKTSALAISFFYLLAALIYGKEGDWAKMLLFLILPLACIFVGEAMGDYTGMTGLAKPPITRTSPSGLIEFLGWVILLAPLIVAISVGIFHCKV